MTPESIEKPAAPAHHIARRIAGVVAAALMAWGFAVLPSVEALAQADNGAGSLELVDPNVFRACGDPRNLPFSNEKGEGFENKLAELFATKLGKKLSYTYFPQATGFVSKTLGSYRCDVIIGFPQGDDQAQVTVPYYRTTYALISKAGSGLDDVTTISDPKLRDKRIGIVARTPPSTYMALNGLLGKAKSYPLFIDTRADSSAQAMMDDLAQTGHAAAGRGAAGQGDHRSADGLSDRHGGPSGRSGMEAHAQPADHGKPDRDQQALDQLQHSDP
jgi:hypothetical protein